MFHSATHFQMLLSLLLGTVSTGGRTIINLRFAGDIDGLAAEEEELADLVERLDKASTAYGMVCLFVSWCFEPSQPQRITSGLLRHGDQCRDQADDKQHNWHQHRGQSEWTEA